MCCTYVYYIHSNMVIDFTKWECFRFKTMQIDEQMKFEEGRSIKCIVGLWKRCKSIENNHSFENRIVCAFRIYQNKSNILTVGPLMPNNSTRLRTFATPNISLWRSDCTCPQNMWHRFRLYGRSRWYFVVSIQMTSILFFFFAWTLFQILDCEWFTCISVCIWT